MTGISGLLMSVCAYWLKVVGPKKTSAFPAIWVMR